MEKIVIMYLVIGSWGSPDGLQEIGRYPDQQTCYQAIVSSDFYEPLYNKMTGEVSEKRFRRPSNIPVICIVSYQKQ